MTGTQEPREHVSWRGMHERCRNPNNVSWKNYGGKGVRVCARWSGPTGYANFLADMGPRPPGTSIDRIDSSGNYEPGNCRWADKWQQAREAGPRMQRRAARRRWERLADSVHETWRRRRTLYSANATLRLERSVREALAAEFGEPSAGAPRLHELSVESYFWDEDFDVNYHVPWGSIDVEHAVVRRTRRRVRLGEARHWDKSKRAA